MASEFSKIRLTAVRTEIINREGMILRSDGREDRESLSEKTNNCECELEH